MIFHQTYLVTVIQQNGTWNAICETETHRDRTPLGEGKGDSQAQAINRAVADHLQACQKVSA